MDKLTLEHLSPYLPYGLRMQTYSSKIGYLSQISYNNGFGVQSYKVDSTNFQINGVSFTAGAKPILRPLSDLTKEIEHNGKKFVPYLKLGWGNGTQVIPTIISGNINVIEHYKLLSWHFDVFGLIDAGLAIDINTIKHD